MKVNTKTQNHSLDFCMNNWAHLLSIWFVRDIFFQFSFFHLNHANHNTHLFLIYIFKEQKKTFKLQHYEMYINGKRCGVSANGPLQFATFCNLENCLFKSKINLLALEAHWSVYPAKCSLSLRFLSESHNCQPIHVCCANWTETHIDLTFLCMAKKNYTKWKWNKNKTKITKFSCHVMNAFSIYTIYI